MDFKEYEFSNSQTELIHDVSNDMRFVGIFLKVLGWMSVFGGLLSWWLDGNYGEAFESIIDGILKIFIAGWTTNAANSFNLIVTHEGNDIKNLTIGFGEVRKLYRLLCWVLLLIPVYFIVLLFLFR